MQFGDFYVMEELPHTETFYILLLPVVLPGVTLTGAISWPFPKSDH